MGMKEAIMDFGKQFDYVPEIQNKEKIGSYKHVILLGMGGSHLAGGIIKVIDPYLDLWVHRDYGLPEVSAEFLKESLIVASSYSGNTEEVVDGLEIALKNNLQAAVITVDGKLLEMAKSRSLPFIQMPNTGIQPRSALGFSLVALSHLISNVNALREIEALKGKLVPSDFEQDGKEVASRIAGKTPLVYASRHNFPIAYNWKIKLNETGKIPAFLNVFPELNHNEMTGFDLYGESKSKAGQFIALFLTDENDHPQIKKRMEVMQKIYEDRGVKTLAILLQGETIGEKIFSSLLIADWTALKTAEMNSAEAEQVPLVEEFKKMIG